MFSHLTPFSSFFNYYSKHQQWFASLKQKLLLGSRLVVEEIFPEHGVRVYNNNKMFVGVSALLVVV